MRIIPAEERGSSIPTEESGKSVLSREKGRGVSSTTERGRVVLHRGEREDYFQPRNMADYPQLTDRRRFVVPGRS